MTHNQEVTVQVVDCIGMMYRSLDSLCKDVLPKSSQWFSLMAEGPIDQIRDLLNDLEEAIAKSVAEQSGARQTEEDRPSAEVVSSAMPHRSLQEVA